MKINIFDSNFAHVPNSTLFKTVKAFQYVKRQSNFEGTSIFTDNQFSEVLNVKSKYKIAWQVESPFISDRTFYPMISRLAHLFDLIITYDEKLVQSNPDKYKRANFGGSTVVKPAMYTKSKDVCIVHSGKSMTPNHYLRQRVIDELPVDSFGRGVNKPFKHIEDIYKDYRYVIVIENIVHDNYFSEKLTDAIACGCIPIYLGSLVNADRFFPGLTHFKDFDDLIEILPALTKEYYDYKINSCDFETVVNNFHTNEDWIFNNYLKDLL